MTSAASRSTVTLFLAGDVMTGRGIDQILPHPGESDLYEAYVKSASDYVSLAEQANGPIRRPASYDYPWGDALPIIERRNPDARIVNLETAITRCAVPAPKAINYRMSPENISVLKAAQIDCCALANNHTLDWGISGLLDTLAALDESGIHHPGAGASQAGAEAPAQLHIGADLLIFSLALPDSGVPAHWAANRDRPGLNLAMGSPADIAQAITQSIRSVDGPRRIAVVSIHWGGNWGYSVSAERTELAHRLIDSGDVDIIHGHSSHHAKGIEAYRDKPILYGCGDLLNDYEGITGYEEFRDDLSVMYFATVEAKSGRLTHLEMVPSQIRNMRLNSASREDARWLADVFNREGAALHTRVQLSAENILKLEW